MTRISPLVFDDDGFTQVPLTREQTELIGDALLALSTAAPARRSEIVALVEETGLLITDYEGV